MSDKSLGIPKSEIHKLNLSLADPNSIKIEVVDTLNNTSEVYNSIRTAAKGLGIGTASIRHYFTRNQKKPYKNRYIFRKVKL